MTQRWDWTALSPTMTTAELIRILNTRLPRLARVVEANTPFATVTGDTISVTGDTTFVTGDGKRLLR